MKKIIPILFLFFCQSVQAQNADIDILNAVNSSHGARFGDPVFKGISSSCYVMSALVPVTTFSAGLIKKDRILRWKSYEMAAGIGICMSVSYLLKYAVNRNRPAVDYPFIVQKVRGHSPSFPSGHTSAAFQTAMSLSLNFPKWYVIVPAYAWAGSVAYSRMYLGVHYPSDLAAGILIGTGTAWLSWKINQKIERSRKKKRLVPIE